MTRKGPRFNTEIYTYDNNNGNLATFTDASGTTTLGTLTYTYDAARNRLKTGGTFARSNIPPALASASYNANNQQTAFGTSTETYDLNGNLATLTDASGTTTYTWNARNQLTGISGLGLTGSFTYDSFGRRTGKTINATTTDFVYDGLNPIQEKNGATVTVNLRGPLLMNQRTKLCKQLVLSDEFPTRHPLFPVTASDSTQCLAQSHP